MPTMPGAHQNFVKTNTPLSQETITQLAFPYHTFLVVDTQNWSIIRQHTLILNPQDMTVQEPVKATVVQTIGGAYVDDFGRGLPEVSINGHTGWRLKPMPDGMGLQDGWQAFKALRNDVFRYFTDAKDDVRTYLRNPNIEMRWYNWGEDEYYLIQPTNFQLQRSVSDPLLYQYAFNFTCLSSLQDNMRLSGHSIRKLDTSSAVVSLPTAAFISVDVSNLMALAQTLAH